MYYLLNCAVNCHYSVSLISVSGGSAVTGGAGGSSTNDGTAAQASSTISQTERDFSKVTRPTTTIVLSTYTLQL
jgi:hypothetical protein